MKQNLIKVMNVQISDEFDSAFLYLSMSVYCEGHLDLPGFAHWLRNQYEEELSHALRLIDYMQQRLMIPSIRGTNTPNIDFGTPEEVFIAVLENEEMVTTLINRLYEVALKEKDYALQVELQWFITEQVEEEKSAADILERIRRVSGSPDGLLLIDRELASR